MAWLGEGRAGRSTVRTSGDEEEQDTLGRLARRRSELLQAMRPSPICPPLHGLLPSSLRCRRGFGALDGDFNLSSFFAAGTMFGELRIGVEEARG